MPNVTSPIRPRSRPSYSPFLVPQMDFNDPPVMSGSITDDRNRNYAIQVVLEIDELGDRLPDTRRPENSPASAIVSPIPDSTVWKPSSSLVSLKLVEQRIDFERSRVRGGTRMRTG